MSLRDCKRDPLSCLNCCKDTKIIRIFKSLWIGHIHFCIEGYLKLDWPLWAVVNLNSNRTCPVCTGLPDNSVYWPDPMVQYVSLTRLTYDRGQFSWHSPVRGLTITTPIARSVPGLILGLFNRPYWLSPPWSIIKQSLKLRCCLFKCLYLKHRHNKSKREKTKKIKLKMKGGKIR